MKRILHAGKTLAVGSQHRILVLAHGRRSASREDWSAFCDIVAAEHAVLRGQLVTTLGGVPDAAQRKAALERLPLDFRPPPVAVIADQPIVRSVITVLNWFLKDSHRGFRTDDFQGVAAHMNVVEAEARDLVGFASELAAGFRD